MEDLVAYISDQISISRQSLENMLSNFHIIDLKKGEYFLQSGTICRKMAFISAGYMRMYDIVDGKEITLWIGSGGNFMTSLSSFVFQTSNFWFIQAITNCKLYVISKEQHLKLCQSEPKWLEFDNILLAKAFALLEQRMFAQLHTTAQERFEALLEKEPAIFHHVPLQYIASMIGIAPESLSRLRRNLASSNS